jgi:hypothetical protein
MANGITLKPDFGPFIVTTAPASFYTDTGLSSAVTAPVTITTDTVWYCSPAVATATRDVSIVCKQLDGTTIFDGTIRVGQTTDTYLRPEPTRQALAADSSADAFGKVKSGHWYVATSANATATAALTSGRLVLGQWYVPNSCTIDRIGAEVTTVGSAGSVVRLGIYADNGYGMPGSLVLDAGTIDGTSQTVQSITLGTPTSLSRGVYWFGAACQVADCTVRSSAGAYSGYAYSFMTSAPTAGQTFGSYYQASVTGALPATFSTTPTIGTVNSSPRLHLRIA